MNRKENQMAAKLWTIIRHNYPFIIGIALAAGTLVWAYGCQSQVASINSPSRLVTRDELRIEVEAYLATAELRFADLDRQDEFKAELFNMAIQFMTEGKINPVAVAMAMGNIIGIGAIVSNARKDTRIKSAKSEIETLSKALTPAKV